MPEMIQYRGTRRKNFAARKRLIEHQERNGMAKSIAEWSEEIFSKIVGNNHLAH